MVLSQIPIDKGAEMSIRFSICPHDTQKGIKRWKLLVKELERKSGLKVEFIPFYSFEEELARLNHEFFHIHYARPLIQVELLTKGYLPLAKFKGQVDKIFFITKKGVPENGEIKVALPFLKSTGYGLLEIDLSRVRVVFTKNFEEVFRLVEKDEVDIGVMYNETWEEIDDKKGITIVKESVIETHHIFMVHKSVYQMLKPIFLSLEEMEEATVEDVKKAESIIRKSDILFKIWQLESIANSLSTSPFIGVLIYRDKILYANDYALSLIGIDREELSTTTIFDLVSGVEDENLKKTIIKNLNKRLKGEHGIYAYDILPFKNKKGELIYLKLFSDTVLYMGEYAEISFFVDNTKSIRLENLYNLVWYINEAITKSTLEEEFFEKVVKALVEKIDLELVWIGKEEKDRIVPIYADGRAKGYLEKINISTLESSEEGNGPTGKAFREGKIVINPDSSTSQIVRPWRDNLLKFRLLSSVAIPLKKNGKVEYVLNMYSKHKNFFQDENKEILYEIKNDIEYFLSENDIRRESTIIGDALRSSKSWVLITDEKGNITYVNDFTCETSGYTREELIGKNPRIFKSGYLPEKFYREMWNKLLAGESFEGVFINRKKDGSIFHIEGVIYPLNISNKLTRYVSIGKDITKEYEISSQLNKLKFYDPITGLYNLNGFSFRSTDEMKGDQIAYLILVDIANFTDINKKYGFKTGDYILKVFGERLKKIFQDTDIIGRIGNDEFGVLLTGIKNKDSILVVLEKVKSFLQNKIKVENEEIVISMNAGISIFPDDSNSFEELYNKASIALKNAKRETPGIISFFSREMEEKTEKFKVAESLIVKALDKGLFRFFFQPYFNTSDLTIAGFEALIRIVDEDGKVYTPNLFIDYLENGPFLREFEEWALKEAISKSQKWGKCISVNISARSFSDEIFLDKLLNVPEDAKITYELTERIFLKEPEKVKRFIEELKTKKNLRVAIDDFGTGYSSLIYIKNIFTDVIKIDISFIRSMMENERDRTLVKTIIDLAKNLGMESLAEGVETEAQYELLKKMGCTYVQGYLFSKPLPEDKLEELYSFKEKLQESEKNNII